MTGAGPPTQAAPGSPEKVRVMRLRAALRLPLFHPQDAAGTAEGAPGRGAGPRAAKLTPRGISWNARKKRYWVRVSVDGETRYVGAYRTLEQAVRALERFREELG